MPSFFEPCGLPQMIGALYGALPVAHDTGGLHDTVTCLDIKESTGNGFLFETADPQGLFWAMDQAVAFHLLPREIKARQVARIMKESAESFTHAMTAKAYMALYEKMLKRPLV
jgi:starch synthase/alpha-amylase